MAKSACFVMGGYAHDAHGAGQPRAGVAHVDAWLSMGVCFVFSCCDANSLLRLKTPYCWLLLSLIC